MSPTTPENFLVNGAGTREPFGQAAEWERHHITTGLPKCQLFNFSIFPKNAFTWSFSHPPSTIPESFTQIGQAISEIINPIQLESPPLHTSHNKSSLTLLARFSWLGYRPWFEPQRAFWHIANMFLTDLCVWYINLYAKSPIMPSQFFIIHPSVCRYAPCLLLSVFFLDQTLHVVDDNLEVWRKRDRMRTNGGLLHMKSTHVFLSLQYLRMSV